MTRLAAASRRPAAPHRRLRYARYRLLLHDDPTTPPTEQVIEVEDDDDAKDLARIALLLDHTYKHADLYRGDKLVDAFKRDSFAKRP
jgi:hypothetical protein